ncbi:MAG: Ig-like domain-containing protein [Euryarchaeota archaeon]|nr:Ig-like domain-containing protein [Euryarchaeota archaeon]
MGAAAMALPASVAAILLLIAIAPAISMPASGGTRAGSEGTAVVGHITQDTTWFLPTYIGEVGASPYRILGNVTIDQGVTLTIQPGVQVLVSKGASIYVEGAMWANGTTLSHITFLSYKWPTGMNYSDWESVQFNGSSYGSLNYCDISYSDNGVVVLGGYVWIDRSTFTLNKNQGVNCSINGYVSLSNSSFSSPVYADIVVYAPAKARIEGCTFTSLQHCVILFGEGIVGNNSFGEPCSVGVLCSNSSSYVGDNHFVNCIDGVFVFEADPVVHNNTFIGCRGNGTRFYNSSALFTDNTFASNGAAVDIPYNSRGVIANMSGNVANGIDLSTIYYMGLKWVNISGAFIDSGWSDPNNNYYGNITAQGSMTFYKCGRVRIDNSTIRNNWNGVYAVGTNLLVRDSVITGMVEGAIATEDGCEVQLINVNHDSPFRIKDDLSTVDEWQYLRVQVRNETFAPIQGVRVDVKEEGVPFASVQTGADGNTSWLTVRQSFVSILGSVEPVITVNVSYGGMAFGDNPRQLQVNKTTQMVFTDLGDIWPPLVSGSGIASGAVGVKSGQPIAIAFSEAMNRTSAEQAFSITPAVTGKFAWDGLNLTFTPDAGYNYSSQYTVTITTAATDLRGNPLAQPCSITFTTEESPAAHEAEYYTMYAVMAIVAVLGAIGAALYLKKRK